MSINAQSSLSKPELLGSLKWAHAVNSRQRLREVLNLDSVDVIEVDVCTTHEGEVLAAHSVHDSSDLSMAELLASLRETNKGIKFDFKDLASVESIMTELNKTPIEGPVFLNADVLSAAGADSSIIDGRRFIDSCLTYECGILSLGWCTNETPECKYAPENITDMIELTSNLAEVTFPIRASMIRSAWSDVQKLLEQDHRTLTIWESKPITDDLKEWINRYTDPAKCYYDIDLQ